MVSLNTLLALDKAPYIQRMGIYALLYAIDLITAYEKTKLTHISNLDWLPLEIYHCHDVRYYIFVLWLDYFLNMPYSQTRI